MADLRDGIAPTRVDATAQFPLGLEVDDPRRGFEGNRIKYVQANATVTAFAAVKTDVSFATANQRHATVIITAGAGSFEGVNDCAAVSVSSGQFFWITVKGLATVLSTSSTAGTAQGTAASGNLTDLTTVTSAQAVGKTAIAMSATNTPASGQAYVLLN